MELDVAAIRRLAREELRGLAHTGPADGLNRPLLRRIAELGILPALFPARLGGTSDRDVPASALCRVREGLAAEMVEAETLVAVQGLGSYPIVQSARPEVAERWMPGIARGELAAAFALSEPDAGTDAASLQLAAERDGDAWRLTGEKTWISNAPHADVYTVFARTTPDAGARGVTAFVVDGAADGLGGETIELVADHPVGRLTFDGVHVPGDHVLGELDRGFRVAMRTLDLFRPSVGALGVGMAQAALELATAWSQERHAFGRPISDFQAVSHKLAEMATGTEAARLLVREAATAYDQGREDEITRRAAMAKLYATENAQFVVDAAVQIVGARALVKGHPLEALYREVRAPRIYEGTSEIQRTIIARQLLKDLPS